MPAITDAVGNNLTATFNTGTVLTVDKTAPTITITEPGHEPGAEQDHHRHRLGRHADDEQHHRLRSATAA